MQQRPWAFVAIFLVPACSLYFGADGQDAGPGGGGAVDAGRIVADAFSIDAFGGCAVKMSYDWNDGTTQGWTASTSASNSGGALVFTNQGNGSLQAFGPQGPSSLAETDSISFRVQIDRYSGVTAPSQLTASSFSLNTPLPGDGTLQFSLDLSTLAFGQPRVFTFPVSTGKFTGSLSRAAFLGHVKFASLLFATPSFSSNSSSGTLDDLVIESAACAL